MSQMLFTTRTNKRYITSVTLEDKREVSVHFNPVHNFSNTGDSIFVTSDDNVINALKKHPYFNVRFFEIPESIKDTKSLTQTKSDITLDVSGITNTNMAIEWIEANTAHKFNGRPSKSEVLEVANTLGIQFTDWKA